MASIDVDVAPGALALLTVEEAAQVLRFGRTFAYQQARLYLDTGGVAGIPVVQIGGCFRVPRWALLELITDGPAGASLRRRRRRDRVDDRRYPADVPSCHRRGVTRRCVDGWDRDAWLVFEELLLASTSDDDSSAGVGVGPGPGGADGLGEGHRGPRGGPASPCWSGDPARSRAPPVLFAAGVYELTVPNGVTVDSAATVDTIELAPSPTSRTAIVDAAQLSLLAFEP